MHDLGFGITLDPTYALRSGKADDQTLVFRLDDLMSDSRAAGDVFVRTKMLLHLGMIIANADGVIDSTERDRLKAIIENTSGLSMDERRRLTSDLRGLETDAAALTDWTKRLKAAPIEQRQELGDQLVKIAQADGTVEKGEVVQLEKLFKLMELSQQSLYQSLHMASAAQAVVSRDDAIPIIIPAGPEFGYAIPERPSSPSTPASRIDFTKLAAIRNETMGTVSILDEIFRDEEVIDASAIVPATPQDSYTDEDAADGLDGRHRALLLEILARQQWSRPEFDGLVKQVGLMPSAVMETLNHWSLEKFEDLVLEGDDPIYPNIELIPPEAFGAAA